MQSRRTLEHVSRQLNSAIFGKRKSTSARRRRRLRNGLERLEERTLLATVIWANPTGGDWRVGSNWSTGAEPTAIDDVVIPNYPGSPSIFLTAGTALVKSVTSFENLRLDGGRFTADTLTFSEGKLQIGAAQISGTLTEGIAEASNGAIFSNFATAIGTILNILPNASVSIAGSRTLEIGGSASIASGDTVNFSRSGPGTKLIVSGTLTASNVTFQNSFGFYVTGIEITGNGRLISTNNNFSVSSLSVLNGATVLPFDWSNNVFETDLTVPWYAVPSLSANQGGSNNVRFTTINIAAGVMPAGNTLTLARIGTDTASHANLRYRFPADFTVASGAILTINNDTVVELAANQELRIEGRANLLPGSTLSIEQSVPATEVIVTGILDVDHASILQGNPAWSTTVTIADGGRLLADSSTFTVKTLALLNGSVVGSTDWRNSIFDTELNIPWQSVANLSAATGGRDNVRFKTIRITEGTVPAGSSLTISQIGTDITSYANLLYRFGEDFTVSSGATLTVSNNTTLMVDANQTLLISGNANLRPGATLSLETSFPPTTLTVTGTINVDHATITRSSNSWNESFVVSNGGKLLADGAVISTRNLSLLNGSTIAPGEWKNSTFDTTLTIPWQAQRYLSAAGGGADNVRFQTINLAGNTIPAGQTLSLSNIGTDTTSHANLLYRFPDNMTVAIDGGLALEADTHLEIEQGTTLTIDGGAVLLAGSVLSLMPESENTRVVVNGQMIVAEATITESRDLIRDTTLIIRSGGGITAVDSTFSTSRVIIEDGAAIDATSFNGNIFDTILTLPWNVHRYLSSAGGGSDNVRFRSIDILAGSMPDGSNLNLTAIGIDEAFHDTLSYRFTGNFTAQAGSSITVAENMEATLAAGNILRIEGEANFLAGSTLTLEANAQNTQLIVTGTLVATEAIITRNIDTRETAIRVFDGGRILADNSIFSTTTLAFDNLSALLAGDWRDSIFDTNLYIPWQSYPFLSANTGGHDNIRFTTIAFNAGTLPSGETLELANIGTDIPSHASLKYRFSDNFIVDANATLVVGPSVQAELAKGKLLTIDGAIELAPQSQLVLDATGTGTALVVNGSLSADSTMIAPSQGAWITNMTVSGSANVTATNSTFPGVRQNWSPDAAIRLMQGDGELASVGQGGIDQTIANFDAISVTTGSTLEVSQSLRVNGSGPNEDAIAVSYTSTLDLNGSLTGTPTTDAIFDLRGTLVFSGSGNNSKPQQLSVLGSDLGAVPSGFLESNFGYGTIRLAGSTYVRLVNTGQPKALYVNTLVIPAGTTLDLNGHKLYVRASSINGTLVSSGSAATPIVVPDGGPLAFATPTPGNISVAQGLNTPDIWTVTTNSTEPIFIQVNPGTQGVTAPLSPPLENVRLELVDSTGQVIASARNFGDGKSVSLESGTLVAGATYSIRISPHPDFPGKAAGNYVVTALESGTIETAYSLYVQQGNSEFDEGQPSNVTPFEFVVTRFGDLSNVGSVAWSVTGAGQRPANELDFVGGAFPSGTVTFAAGEKTKTFQVLVRGDSEWERHETFSVSISADEFAAAIDVATAGATILNDDAPDKSDLIIQSLSVPPVSKTGTNVQINWTERNDGSIPITGSWTTRIRIVNRDTGFTVYNQTRTFENQLIQPGVAVPRSVVFVPQDGPPGVASYDVSIYVDSFNAVNEDNELGTAEDNNERSSSFEVVLQDYPALSILEIQSPAVAQLGVSFDVHWLTTNSGVGSLNKQIQDRVYLSSDQTLSINDLVVGTVTIADQLPVAPGETYSATASITLPLDNNFVLGNYYLIVATDHANAQYELDETNNTLSRGIAVELPPLPDLTVTGIQSPLEAVAGQTITISWDLQNGGEAPTNHSWTDRVYLSNDNTIGNDTLLGNFPMSQVLVPGQSVSRTQSVTLPTGIFGTYRIVVVTDANNEIVEFLNEDNNTFINPQGIDVYRDPSANLIVSSVVALNEGLFSGETATIEWTVKNTGNAATNSQGWTDGVYISSDATLSPDDVLLGTKQNASYLNLNADYITSLTVDLPEDAVGTRYFIVKTDIYNQLIEAAGEYDNVRASRDAFINLSSPSDLVPSEVFYSANAIAGNETTVNWLVQNTGTGRTRSTGWVDRIYLSLNNDLLDPQDILLGQHAYAGVLEGNNADYRVTDFNVTIPENATSDSAYFIVETDADDNVYEHLAENNNVVSGEFPVRIVASPRPDLTVESITPISSAVAGQPLALTYSVYNQSVNSVPESTWYDSVYLSRDRVLSPDTDILLGKLKRSGGFAGEETLTFNETLISPDTTDGPYFIIVDIDSDADILEVSDNDNTLATSTPASFVIDPPDLAVTSITAGTALAGREFTLDYLTRNQGNHPTITSSWENSVYLSTNAVLDSNDILLDRRSNLGPLNSQQSELRHIVTRLPVDVVGSYYLIVFADSTNEVFETNNSNNILAKAITISQNLPDLVVTTFEVRTQGTTVAPGETLSFDVDVHNSGAGATFGHPWWDRVILSSDLSLGNEDDQTLESINFSSTLEPGDNYQLRSRSLRLPSGTPDGTYYLFYICDANQTIEEVSEANNVVPSAEIVVSINPGGGVNLPDLRVTALNIPSTFASGNDLPIEWTIRNAGIAGTTTSTWRDQVWLSTDNNLSANDIFVGSYTHSGVLPANQSYSKNISWPVAAEFSGTYYVIVRTDSGNNVPEGLGEQNNVFVSANPVTITLGPVPDLQITNISAPTQASSGRTLQLTWQSRNAGQTSAGSQWTESVYLSLDTILDRSYDLPIGYRDYSGTLPAGQFTNRSGVFSLPQGVGGNYYVLVVIDFTDQVDEREFESNNVSSSPQKVAISHLPPADLVVGTIVVPANSTSGSNASISYTVQNTGTFAATGSWSDTIYISADNQWDTGDPLFGEVSRSGSLAPGASYTETLTAPLPGIVPGAYKVIVRSDIRNSILEGNEDNNVRASLNSFTAQTDALQLGVERTGTIANNQLLYYRVNVPQGETLVIEASPTSGSAQLELYSTFNAVPSTSNAEAVSLRPDATQQRIVISESQAGHYYVVLAARNVSAQNVGFTILARTVPFSIFTNDFGSGGTAGDRTILVEGAKFDRSITATLINGSGQKFPAVGYEQVNETRFYSTFDLRDVPQGVYTVEFHKQSTNETLAVTDSFHVVFAQPSLQPISLTYPESFSRLRAGRPPAILPVTLSWRNNSLNDVVTPLIHFAATEPFADTPEDAKLGNTSFAREFMGFSQTDGPRSVLLPGDYVSRTFFVLPRETTPEAPPEDIHYFAGYFYEAPTAGYIWDFDLSQLDLSYLTDDEAISAINAFTDFYTEHVGDFREAVTGALLRIKSDSPSELVPASRLLLQDVFDRFVAGRGTSLIGNVYSAPLAHRYDDLVAVLADRNSEQQFVSPVLLDGSFVFPKLPAGSYALSIKGGNVAGPANLVVEILQGQAANVTVPLVKAASSTAPTIEPLEPTGLSPVEAPFVFRHGTAGEVIQGNVLDTVLHLLSGVDYRVDIIGDVPAGFAMDQEGNYSYFSERSEAFVMHYDVVLPDKETRVGRLFENEIRSRGALVISLKTQLTRDVRSLDPNDIIGPAGYGNEKWVSAAELLNYTIRFENDPLEATSAAHSVEVTQVLDSDLDLNSFRFGNFGFGGRLYEVPDRVQQFTQRIDLREEMGIFVEVFATLEHASRSVTWIFRSITSSGNFTSDPNDGFLPLNNTPPEGDGFVSYSVRAKRTAPAGSRLDASARIIFDGNAPLDTSTIFNTLDPASPTSLLVGDIVMQSDNRMLVSWDGTDGEVGAGVSHYNVYVSQDGQQFELWLDSTDLLKAEYAGETGVRYEFLTIAEDHVGNLESEIKLPDSGRPHAYAGGTYEGVEGETLTLTGIGTDPNEGQTVRFEWDLDYDGLSFTVDSTAQNPNLILPDGPGQRTVALRVWDNGNVPLVSPISIATISIANAAPVIEVTQASIRGGLQTTLRNTGTWSDFSGDVVTLTTSLGTVDLATDGTWQWSFMATAPLQNVPVTVTATDEDGDQNSINFTISTGSIPVEAVITPVNETGLTYGEQLELEIFVQPTIASNLVPTGQVQLFVNSIPYGAPLALSMGKATALIAGLAAGASTITADYLDPSSTHELTEPGQISITVEKAVLTIRANDATTRAGRELPVFDYDVEGLQYDDDDTNAFTGKPQLGVASDVPKYPGEFPINVTVGDLQSPNYEFAFVDGTIFVGWTWTNPYVAYDVNADESVTPIDALIIMNYLNRGGQTSLQDPDHEPSRFYDVNGDTTVTPIDALRIINYLNRRTGTGGEGEERPNLMGAVDNVDSNAVTEVWDDEKKRRIQLIDQAFGDYEG